jgi:hypothetical protein
MKVPRMRKSIWPMTLMAIVLLMASAMAPMSARAAMMTYFYTGTPFEITVGTPPGNHINVQFTAELSSSTPLPYIPTAFTMSCGSLVLSSTDPGIDIAEAKISILTNNLPSEWFFHIVKGSTEITSRTPHPMGFPPVPDYGDIFSDGSAFAAAQHRGSWTATPAPLPPNVLLLGTSLLGLGGWRRFRKG